MQSLRKNKYDSEPMLRSCGIAINSNFVQVEGRVLPAPKVLLAFGFWNCSWPVVLSTWPLNFVSFLINFLILKLKVGNGEDFFPRNGRWNFNNKVGISYTMYISC